MMENLESHEILQFHFPGLPWKVIEFEYRSWEVMENVNLMIFPRTTKQKIPQMNDHFGIILKTTSQF